MRGASRGAVGALAGLAALAAMSGACVKTSSGPASPSASVVVSAASYIPSDLEQQTHAKINQYRVGAGLPALSWNDAIAAQARQHSVDMASGAAAFGHDGFTARVAAIGQTMSVAGAAENVAMASGMADPASAVVTGWLESPTHKPNIEGDYKLTGIGVAVSPGGAAYFTQVFIKPR